jgi:hypothetical protein
MIVEIHPLLDPKPYEPLYLPHHDSRNPSHSQIFLATRLFKKGWSKKTETTCPKSDNKMTAFTLFDNSMENIFFLDRMFSGFLFFVSQC